MKQSQMCFCRHTFLQPVTNSYTRGFIIQDEIERERQKLLQAQEQMRMEMRRQELERARNEERIRQDAQKDRERKEKVFNFIQKNDWSDDLM